MYTSILVWIVQGIIITSVERESIVMAWTGAAQSLVASNDELLGGLRPLRTSEMSTLFEILCRSSFLSDLFLRLE